MRLFCILYDESDVGLPKQDAKFLYSCSWRERERDRVDDDVFICTKYVGFSHLLQKCVHIYRITEHPNK